MLLQGQHAVLQIQKLLFYLRGFHCFSHRYPHLHTFIFRFSGNLK